MMRRALAAAAAALLITACGDEGEGRYDAQVAAIRQAVEAGDRDAAIASLEEVGDAAFHAHAAGDVSDQELAELAVLLDRARVQVEEELATPTTTAPTTAPPTTTPTTAPPTTTAPPSDASDEGDGGGNDEKEKKKDRGRGGDDGDDDDDD